MSIKINALEIENIKRIRALALEPAENGLTVIGGKNNQGKTSVLDAIAWALGGERYRPSQPQRNGSVLPPALKITLSNGLIVERTGRNGSLKVIDPSGNKGGQQLLNSFVEQFALDLPKFMQASGKEKAQTLLRIIGVGDKLYELDAQENSLYNERRTVGQIADQKRKYANEMNVYEGVPEQPLSASDLIKQQQDMLARNGENARKRAQRDRYEREYEAAKQALLEAQSRFKEAEENAAIARANADGLVDESTAQLEANIAEIEKINVKVRANLEHERAVEEAKGYEQKYAELTGKIEEIRQSRFDLLNGAKMPLEGLSVENGELTFNGQKWDNMSGSQQLIAAAAIVRKLNPDCGFVLIDKTEQLDRETLEEFGAWLENEGLQAIATRVSTGDECSIIIEDGCAKNEQPKIKEWKAGAF